MHIPHTTYYTHYDPSYPTAIVGAVLFSLAAAATVGQYIYYRTWYFWPCVLGALMEMCGLIDRAVSTQNQTNRDVFIVQYCMTILAPAVIAASCYQTYGRILLWVVPEDQRGIRQMWVPVKWITPIFVTGDVFSFMIQLVGAVQVSAADVTDIDRIHKGQNTVKAGLGIQLAVFGFFTIVGLRFLFVSSRWAGDMLDGKKWKHLNYAVNAACALILIRSVYRMIEFSEGQDSGVNKTEVYFYVFDALMILILLAIFILIHPGQYLADVGFRRKALAKGRNGSQVELERGLGGGVTRNA